MVKEVDGGRGDGNRSDGREPSRKAPRRPRLELSPSEQQLMSDLVALAGADYGPRDYRPDLKDARIVKRREFAREQGAVLLHIPRDGSGHDRIMQALRRHDIDMTIQPPEDARCGDAHLDAQHSVTTGMFIAVNARKLQTWINGDAVSGLLDKLERHRQKILDGNPAGSDEPPLSRERRARLIGLREDCRIATDGAGSRGGRTDHPGIGQHESGGRE